MNKITIQAEKGLTLLDLYQKYFNNFLETSPHNPSKTPYQNVIDRRLHRKIFTFERWFEDRLKYVKAEKIYGKEALQKLIDMGVEINLVDKI